MEDAIRTAIEKQAKKLIARNKKEFADHADFKKRFTKRTAIPFKARTFRRPGIWNFGNHFDPNYCIKHSKYLSRVIWQKIRDRQYQVEPALLFSIPKDSGGTRDVMVFSIPDAAIANLFNRKLRDRNKNIQSPFCYSYRNDRTLFDAVIRVGQILSGGKTYVIQYDFAKYFDSISHDYINFILNKDEFLISAVEKHIVQAFLNHRYAAPIDYKAGVFKRRERGVPQGSSLSLFLSNIAGHELDTELEKSNGSFVRFADDIVCTAANYNDSLLIKKNFKEHCYYSGISINIEKSPGICLFDDGAQDAVREYFLEDNDLGPITMLREFDYIGHKFNSAGVGISDKAFARIKSRIGHIIHVHLLHNPRSRNLFNPARVGSSFRDWDLVTCINEIRKYIYGGLSEYRILGFMHENQRISRFRGLMGFYPLVTRVDQFSRLDGWLVSALRRAYNERSRILNSNFGLVVLPISQNSIISGDWYDYHSVVPVETRLPSFVLAWRAARKSYKQYGLADFETPDYYSSSI